MADPNQTLASMQQIAGSIAGQGDVIGAVKQGMGLAQTAQQLEVQKQQLEQQKDQLESAKMETVLGHMTTLSKMNPQVGRRILPQMIESARKRGIAVDPALYESIATDEEEKRKVLSSMPTFDEMRKDPAKRADFLQRAGQYLDFSQLFDIEKTSGTLAEKATSAELRAQMAEKSNQTKVIVEQQKEGAKFDDKVEKDFQKLAGIVANPSGRTNLSRYQQNMDRAGAAATLLNSVGVPEGEAPPENESKADRVKRFNNANQIQLQEMARAADQLVSNAQATISGTEHMTPKTLQTQLGVLQSWASGGPAPANAGEFLESFQHMIDRERKFYQDRRDKALHKIAPGFERARNADPDRFNRIMSSTYDEPAVPAAPPAGGTTAAAPPRTAPTPPPAPTPDPYSLVGKMSKKLGRPLTKEDVDKTLGKK